MARNQTVTVPPLNILALNRLKTYCYYEPVRVDFSPVQKPNQQFEDILPTFNNDRNFFTPAFIIPREKIPLQNNISYEKNKFEARITHSQKQDSQQTPRYEPTDNKYCQLCKYCFDEYWEHVNGKHHSSNIKKSKFNKDIEALCASFKPQLDDPNTEKPKANGKNKTKKIAKKKLQPKRNKSKYSKLQNKISKSSKLKTTEYISENDFQKMPGNNLQNASAKDLRITLPANKIQKISLQNDIPKLSTFDKNKVFQQYMQKKSVNRIQQICSNGISDSRFHVSLDETKKADKIQMKMEESLKITLLLGNCSTNLMSNNHFRQP